MIENKVGVGWSLESPQSLVAGCEDCEVRVEMLSLGSLTSHQPGELDNVTMIQYCNIAMSHCVTMSPSATQCYNVTQCYSYSVTKADLAEPL